MFTARTRTYPFFWPRWWRKKQHLPVCRWSLTFSKWTSEYPLLASFQHWSSSWSLIISQVQGWTFCAAFFSLGLCEKSPNLTHPRFWSWISQVLIIQELHQKFKIQGNHIWMIPPQQFRYRGGSQIAGIDGFSPNMVQYSYRPIPYPDLLWVNFPYLPG